MGSEFDIDDLGYYTEPIIMACNIYNIPFKLSVYKLDLHTDI